MTVICPGCGWSAEVPEDKIPDGGITATCRKCQAKFEVKKELKPVAEQPPILPRSESRDTKPCPLCGEEILAVAKKCKHCGSMLDEVKEEPRPPVQEPSQTAASTEAEPEKRKIEDPATSKERKPLSNLEKVLFVIFGLAVVSGISGNNSAAPAMLLLYIGVLVFRLRKKKAEYHPLEMRSVTPPTKSRARVWILLLILIILTMAQVVFIKSESTNTPQYAAPVQSNPADEALGKIKDVVKSKKNDYDNKKYSETLCAERYRPGSEEYKDCVHFVAKDIKSKGL